MSKMRQQFTVLVTLCLLALFGCHKEEKAEKEQKVTCVSDTMLRILRFDTAKIEKVEEQLKLSGRVEVDESKMLKVFPLVGGQVEKVTVELGDYVKKGDILAVLKSAEAAEIEKDIVGDSSRLEIAAKVMQSSEDMYKSGLLSEKDFVIAKNEYQRAKAEYARSRELYGIYSLGKGSHYIIRAPMSGFVVDKDINAGMQVRSDNQNHIFTISNLTDVWVIANVYESDIQKIKDNFPVNVQTVAYPDKVFEGKIEKIYNVIDPNSRVLKVRIRLENPEVLLKPGMFATIMVHHSTDNTMLAIPSKAIIFDSNKNYVMVFKDACHIETREIEIGSVVNNRKAYLIGGLLEGEAIISKYQLLVFNMLDN